MENFLILDLPILLLLLPIVLQVIVGQKILKKRIQMPYWLLSILTIILEIILTFVGFIFSLQGQQMKEIPSLSPGIFGFGFLAIIILVSIIIGQNLIKNTRVKKD